MPTPESSAAKKLLSDELIEERREEQRRENEQDAAQIPDRRVHAECATFEVVRYERAGKWYVESKVKLVPAVHVGVGEAAHRAVAAEALGGEINYGVPGGSVFDRKVTRLGAEPTDVEAWGEVDH